MVYLEHILRRRVPWRIPYGGPVVPREESCSSAVEALRGCSHSKETVYDQCVWRPGRRDEEKGSHLTCKRLEGAGSRAGEWPCPSWGGPKYLGRHGKVGGLVEGGPQSQCNNFGLLYLAGGIHTWALWGRVGTKWALESFSSQKWSHPVGPACSMQRRYSETSCGTPGGGRGTAGPAQCRTLRNQEPWLKPSVSWTSLP